MTKTPFERAFQTALEVKRGVRMRRFIQAFGERAAPGQTGEERL